MSKQAKPEAVNTSAPTMSNKTYKHTLHQLQIELVKLQRDFIRCGDKILVIFEGRDAAGKDGTIKRIVQHLSLRKMRVVAFEHRLVRSGIKLLLYYLDISKAEQKQRLIERKVDPLTQWKANALDAQALKKWKPYTLARNAMLACSHNPVTPWSIVRADDKHLARLNIIKKMLSRLDYTDQDEQLVLPDPQIVFTYDAAHIENGVLAPQPGRSRNLAAV